MEGWKQRRAAVGKGQGCPEANADVFTLPIKDRILHSVVDGPIDADKLDYLVRDSRKLNVPYGAAIDFERLSKVLTVVHEAKNESMWAAMGVHENGKVSAESVAFTRYCMFGAVYWHRTSRSIKAMLHRAVWDMLARSTQERGSPTGEMESSSYGSRSIFDQEFQDIPDSTKKKLREGFMDTILKNKLPAAQQELFEESKNQGMKLPLWPGINIADLQVLAWLWRQCGDRGRRLLEALAGRSLYKRVLVISKEKSKDIWSKAHKFAPAGSASERLNLDYRM